MILQELIDQQDSEKSDQELARLECNLTDRKLQPFPGLSLESLTCVPRAVFCCDVPIDVGAELFVPMF